MSIRSEDTLSNIFADVAIILFKRWKRSLGDYSIGDLYLAISSKIKNTDALNRYDPERSALPKFIEEIGTFVCLDLCRSVRNMRARGFIPYEEGAQYDLSVGQIALFGLWAAVTKDNIEHAFKGVKFTKKQRVVVRLKILEDMSFSEIATETKSTEPNVRALYNRGIKRLRKHLLSTGLTEDDFDDRF